jgi:hypothetical protein
MYQVSGEGPTFSHHLLYSFLGTILKFSHFHLDRVGSHRHLGWKGKNESNGPHPCPRSGRQRGKCLELQLLTGDGEGQAGKVN